MLNGRATTSGRAVQGDHKNAARPEVVAQPYENSLKVDLRPRQVGECLRPAKALCEEGGDIIHPYWTVSPTTPRLRCLYRPSRQPLRVPLNPESTHPDATQNA